jgi:hypothetical protein
LFLLTCLLHSLRYGGATGDDNDHNVTVSLRDLFKSLDHTNKPVPPMLFVHLFRSAFPQFNQRTERGYAQQDAVRCVPFSLADIRR